ncbi:MAG: hypothetical protein LAP13_11355 [Acidobacteriia bacterium]|nr:hypothetical protein [Terriglobia bacterium]
MSLPSPNLSTTPNAEAPKARPPGLSPPEALAAAWHDTLRLLLRPLDARRWVKLSLICLFLGGGTPTAAFQWSLSSLPVNIKLSYILDQAREYVSRNLGLSILVVILGLALALSLLYLRAVFRFSLVDVLIKRDASPLPAWRAVRPLGESYFFWLVGTLALLGVTFSAVAITAFPYIRSTAAAGTRNLLVSLLLLALLAVIALSGLALALVIMLTDDLVVPLMYAERLTLPAAWRKLGQNLRREPRALLIYILLRLLVSVGVSVAVLFFLFPILVTLFSGAIIVAALIVLSLHALGGVWTWNSFTILLATVATLLLSGLLLMVLGVVGMPGQVFIQDFGLRFIASRYPSFQSVWRASGAPDRYR